MLGKAHLCVMPAGGCPSIMCSAHHNTLTLPRCNKPIRPRFFPNTPASVSSSGRPGAADARSKQRDH